MAITITGTTVTATGGTSATPLTLADFVTALPANFIQNGNTYSITGVTLINIGDGGTTPTVVQWLNALVAGTNVEIKLNGKAVDTPQQNTEFILGDYDAVSGTGINGCTLRGITVSGNAGLFKCYGSTVDIYRTTYWFGRVYAYDSVFGQYGDRLGRAEQFWRNTVLSSDGHRNGGLDTTLIPGILNIAAGGTNTRIVKSSDVVYITNVVDETSTNMIFEDKAATQIQWAYSNAGIKNYGRLVSGPTQATGYNDSTFTNYQSPSIHCTDANGADIAVQSATITDAQGTAYTGTGTAAEFAVGIVHFANIVLEDWVDRPGGVAGTQNYTDHAPFTLTVTDTSGVTHSQVISLDDHQPPGTFLQVVLPVIPVAPKTSGVLLAETIWPNDEAHDVTYVDTGGLSPVIELLHHPVTGGVTTVTSGTMTEISPGLYHYNLNLPALTLPAVPGYYTIKVTVGNQFDASLIEIVPAGQTLTVASISAAVWAEPVRTVTNPELANLDVAVSTRLASTSYTAAPTAAAVATAVWNEPARTVTNTELANLDVAVSTRLAASAYTAPDSAATISAAVWAEPVRTVTNAELANLDAAVSSRLAASAYTPPDTAATISAAVWAEPSRTITNPELANLDAAVSSRLASSAYVQADNASIATTLTRTTELWQLMGADISNPLVVDDAANRRFVGPSASPVIDQSIITVGSQTTVTRL